MIWKHRLGKTAEWKAWKLLRSKNYKLLHKNYRNKLGEIDLVVEKDNMIVFVEVKSMTHHQVFAPQDHFNHAKRKKQILLARAYLSGLRREMNARIDLVTVIEKDGDFFIEHYEDAIHEDSL